MTTFAGMFQAKVVSSEGKSVVVDFLCSKICKWLFNTVSQLDILQILNVVSCNTELRAKQLVFNYSGVLKVLAS